MASKSQEKALVELRKHCPEIFKDGQIDFHLLSEKYGQRPNHYEMFWNGKYESKESLKNPSLGCLRPVVGDSVNWDTTGNVFIEGDNLEVLKLMRKAYKGSVKCIYIDPPYNTGNDFVYKDNFKNGVEAYLEATGQVGRKNAETEGRHHTNWLNMIYPRLLTAKDLLRDDGCIFMSIDESEIGNLRKVSDEVFGEGNFVGSFIWKKKDGGGQDSEHFVIEHEYVLCYAKSICKLDWKHKEIGISAADYNHVEDKTGRKYGKQQLRKWGSDDLREDVPSLYYDIPDPDGNPNYPIKYCKLSGKILDSRWRHCKKEMQKMIAENRIHWEKTKYGNGKETWKPYEKLYMDEADSKKVLDRSMIMDVGGTKKGTDDLANILKTKRVFDYPKPVDLVKKLVSHVAHKDGDIVLDFFAGSGTTAQAVFELNSEDSVGRNFICVQLPEKVENNKDQSVMFNFLSELGKKKNIAEATKERIRRASKKVQDENPDYKGDLGFRVFKLDKSNFKKRYEINKDGVDVRTPQQKWEDSLNAIKADHQMLDVFFEQALNDGISLSICYKQHDVGGVKIFQANTNQIILTTDGFSFARAKDVSVAVVKMIKSLQRLGAGSQTPNVYFYGAALRSDPKTWLQIHTVLSQFEVAFNQL